MPQSLHSLGVHIVFSTKGRLPYLTDPYRPRAHAYIATLLADMGCHGITVGGIEDHVHILCLFTKSYTTADVLKKVKTESSKTIKTFDENLSGFQWQAGYGLFGVSPRDMDMVRSYVSKQAEHHQRESFQDEFRRLLRDAEMEFDEKYVWDCRAPSGHQNDGENPQDFVLGYE